jgi:hypothetical protein
MFKQGDGFFKCFDATGDAAGSEDVGDLFILNGRGLLARLLDLETEEQAAPAPNEIWEAGGLIFGAMRFEEPDPGVAFTKLTLNATLPPGFSLAHFSK